ncbi:hypothetical protein HNR46_002728 [Haloferula luteola]|uniref:Uncharacterized protein n=1 Tax=Haloferula luteola TaxID=595692 RepID=A0A840V3C6_9BACT|nr:hypothetical protein [Haloferula luteola]MBB5352482.1 hypothetical protein [Haloferula luteola]
MIYRHIYQEVVMYLNGETGAPPTSCACRRLCRALPEGHKPKCWSLCQQIVFESIGLEKLIGSGDFEEKMRMARHIHEMLIETWMLSRDVETRSDLLGYANRILDHCRDMERRAQLGASFHPPSLGESPN